MKSIFPGLFLCYVLLLHLTVILSMENATQVQNISSLVVASENQIEKLNPENPPSRKKHRVHHRKSDNESVETEGTWQVFNWTAPHEGHKHPPSCILATMKASLVIPIRNEMGQIVNKTIVIPKTAQVQGQCGEKQQWFTLVWNNTHNSGKLVKKANLALLFTKEDPENVIYLTHVWSSLALFLEDNSGKSIINSHLPSQNLIMTIKEAHLWRTPNRFAYQCHNRIELKLHATTFPLKSVTGDNIIVDPVYNEEAFLVFHQLHIETFRHQRFGNHFTHLNYDCRFKWAYSYMPGVVGIGLALLIAIVSISFAFRRKLGCAPGSIQDLEETEDDTNNDENSLNKLNEGSDADDEKSYT